MTVITSATEALQRAIDAAGGTQAALATKVGYTQQAVSEWVRFGRVSRYGVLAVEAATGVPRHELRPDLYAAQQAA